MVPLTGPLFRQSEATYIGQWKVVLLFFSENIKKSDHQPITKWIIYYLFFRHATPLLFLPNDKNYSKSDHFKPTLPVRFLKSEMVWIEKKIEFWVGNNIFRWKCIIFEPRNTFPVGSRALPVSKIIYFSTFQSKNLEIS